MVIQTSYYLSHCCKFGACQKGEPAGRILDDFGNFFNGFAKSPRLIILGDPGADSGGEGKSKQAGKYGTKEK